MFVNFQGFLDLRHCNRYFQVRQIAFLKIIKSNFESHHLDNILSTEFPLNGEQKGENQGCENALV